MSYSFPIYPPLDYALDDRRNGHLETYGNGNAYPLVTGADIVLDLKIDVTGAETYDLTIDDTFSLTRTITVPSGNVDGKFWLRWTNIRPWEQIAMWKVSAYKEFDFADSSGGTIAGSILVEGLYRDVSGVAELVDLNGPRLVDGDSDALLRLTITNDAGASAHTLIPSASMEWDDPSDMPEALQTELWRADDLTSQSTPFTSTVTDPLEPTIDWIINNFQFKLTH